MKTVKITILGDILAIDYCSTSLYDEDNDFYNNYYLTCGWDRLESLKVDDGEENLIKKKGKYVKTKEFFHEKMGPESDHPLPVEVHARTYCNVEIEYNIELEDDEEFDIKKVQLLKSIEFDTTELPYFIVADYILYDGKKVKTEDTSDFCPEEKCHDEGELTEFVDRDY